MERKFSNLFGLFTQKAVPDIDPISEATRDALPKAYIPKFIYKPPFGYPRFVDLPNIRRLAATPYVEMCISTIVDEICAVQWEIVPIEGKEDSKTFEEHKEKVMNFFKNPNTNKESFEEIRRKYIRDILEIDSGVIVKMFNQGGEMVEIIARDGGTFTKNPDIYGMMTDREDLLIESFITSNPDRDKVDTINSINPADAREKAAYFQYGWISGARPVPFGKREIIWFERNPRTDNIYGRAPIEVLANTIQTLIYAVEHNLEYFSDNQIPRGIIGLDGSNTDEIKAFKDQWKENQRVKDSAGNWKKKFHHIPVTNKSPVFTRLELTNSEMELLEGQKWWAKLVWASFGVTGTELGFTEDAKGMSNQIVQSNIFKKRTINPILRLEEYKINREIISEFEFDDVEFKFTMFDVEDETKKATLYQAQLSAGYKSINEVRVEEGMDEVEWGDKMSQEETMEMQQKFAPNENGPLGNEVNKENDKNKKEKEIMGGKKKEEKKSNPLILGEFEEIGESRLKKSIIYLLRVNEAKIKALIDQEYGQDKLKEIKGVIDIIKIIKGFLSFEGIKKISDAVIKNTFTEGHDSAEKQLEQNLEMNLPAMEFIQDYTFNNIKGMTEEVAQDLRQELERGIMQGESITKIKARVEKVFDVGENRAEMIARTETNRAEGQGKLQAFKSSGQDLKKEWHAHFDERTSGICKRLHGQVVGMNENFKDKQTGWEGPTHPAHVNCRSSVLYIGDE